MQAMKLLTRRLNISRFSRTNSKLFGLSRFCTKVIPNNLTPPTQQIPGKYHNNSFLDRFHDQVTSAGDDTALIFDDMNMSYSEFYKISLQSALYLREKYNVNEGDVITTISSNLPQIKSIIVACEILNCAFFPLNPNLPSSILNDYINSVNAKLVICEKGDNKTNYKHDGADRNVLYISPPNKSSSTWLEGDAYHTYHPLMESVLQDLVNNHNNYISPDIASVMSLTSGSTAIPKVVVHTNSSAQAWMNTMLNPLFTKTKGLLTTQPHHMSTYLLSMVNIANGGCLIYPSQIMRSNTATNSQKVLEMVRLTDLYKISTVALIVTPIYELVKLNQSFGNSVNVCFCGGDIIPTQLMSKFMKLHTKNDNTSIMNGYGSTECGVVGASTPLQCTDANANDLDKIENELFYINKAPGVKHKIDPETNELMVKTNALMKCYHNDIQKTADCFDEDGYYKMGDQIDVLYENEEDDTLRFKVIARNKQVIVSDGGYYIFPQNIENILLSHQNVNGAVIVGISTNLLLNNLDKDTYKKPVAFITINCDLDKNKLIDELLLLLNNKSNKNDIPYKIFIIDNIPKSSVGKVNRNELEDLATKYFEELNRKHQQEIFEVFYQHQQQKQTQSQS